MSTERPLRIYPSWRWLLLPTVVLLWFVSCEDLKPRPQPSPTPLPAKVVAGKVERQVSFLDPTFYYLVAADRTVCLVQPPEYAVTPVGATVPCEWRAW